VRSFHPHRRDFLRAVMALSCGLGLAGCKQPIIAAPLLPTPGPPPAGPTPQLRLIGEAYLPSRMSYEGTTVGGFSGIDYDATRDLYLLVSDDRSNLAPARFYTARMALAIDGIGIPELQSVEFFLLSGGVPFPNRRNAVPGVEIPDPEAIRWLPDGNLLWASEGDWNRGFGPSLRESRPDGGLVRQFVMPAMLRMPGFTSRFDLGPRDNLSFEGIALMPDRRSAWVSMENALVQDGPGPRLRAPGGPCRITAFDLTSGHPTRQITYLPDAIPHAGLFGIFGVNGISDILMEDDRYMLVLERAYALGAGYSLRLYRIDTQNASNTLRQSKLMPSDYQPAGKTLVADFGTLGLQRLDNIEGMTWGPILPNQDGQRTRRTLVFVSDDNFNPLQTNQFVACEYMA
jgi:hypothetical protein